MKLKAMLNFKNIFFIDALGALLSAAMIGLILPRISLLIGLPTQTLYFLAVIPVFFAAYSFFCFWKIQPTRGFLAVIMIANSLYCILTASLLAIHFDEITIWGFAYFVSEIMIILSVVAAE